VVRLLIGLRSAITRNQLRQGNRGALIAGLVLALLSGAGTLYLGTVSYPRLAAGADVIALVFGLWLGGHLAQRALSGEPTLRPEMFALLPLRRRALAAALLAVNLADPALILFVVPFAAVIALGAQAGAVAAIVGAAGALLTIVLAGVAGTVAAGILGPGARRGHDIGTMVTALAISVISVAGITLPWLVTALRERSAPWLIALVRVLPSGWAAVAVDAAARSQWLWVALPLAGLAALSGVIALAWPAVLARRMTGAGTPSRSARPHAERRALLPRTAVGAVAAKEVRLWVRDPIRLTPLLIAVIVGAAMCAIPRLTTGTGQLLPFAGAATVVIAGACACNLYGNDGTSLWLTIAVPGSEPADVRGRQLAWLLIAGPYTLALTVLLTALSGQGWAWPWALGMLAALLGGACGLIPLSSLTWVVPLDAAGNPTPQYSLKVHLALIAVALTAAPPAAVALAGSLAGLSWLTWLAVPVGVATGAALARKLGTAAAGRLHSTQVSVLRVLASAG
jgi:ABC-2 type transport system permease protein